MSTQRIIDAQTKLGAALRELKEQRKIHLSYYRPDATAEQRARYARILDTAVRRLLQSMNELDKL